MSVCKSLGNPAHMLSIIDGKPYKSLRCHLNPRGVEKTEYRRRFKLPGDYPMISPDHSEARRGPPSSSGWGASMVNISPRSATLD